MSEGMDAVGSLTWQRRIERAIGLVGATAEQVAPLAVGGGFAAR